MGVSTIHGVSFATNEDGSVALEFQFQGSLCSKIWPSFSAMLEDATSAIDTPEAAAKFFVSAWAAINGCSDFSVVEDRDVHVHAGQDLQGSGTDDLHMLWHRGAP